MTKIFVIYTMLFGYGIPTRDTEQFTNESACQIYLHTRYPESIQKSFQLYCNNIGPLRCQDKDCE